MSTTATACKDGCWLCFDSDKSFGGFLWDVGTTIVGAVCSVCGLVITGATFIYDTLQCDTLTCVAQSAFGAVVGHFTPDLCGKVSGKNVCYDAVGMSKSIFELGVSQLTSNEFVPDASITRTCEDLYGHSNSQCSDRTFFNISPNSDGKLEFYSQNDWLDSSVHTVSVDVKK